MHGYECWQMIIEKSIDDECWDDYLSCDGENMNILSTCTCLVSDITNRRIR